MKENKFRLRLFLAGMIRRFRLELLRMKGYNIGRKTIVEGGVLLDKLNPRGIVIGSCTLIARGAVILSHDHVKRTINDNPKMYRTSIGSNTFIGINTIILPGVNIGNNVIIGSGSVVTKSFPSNCVIAGNPAKIIKESVKIGPYGKFL